ncbi:MAG: hypothetical protein ACP5US_00830 [Candidatus Kryptoniota bacterium]
MPYRVTGNLLTFLIFRFGHPFSGMCEVKDFLSAIFKFFCGVTSDRPNDGFFVLDPGTVDRLLSKSGYDPTDISENAGDTAKILKQSAYEDFLEPLYISKMSMGHLRKSGQTERRLYMTLRLHTFHGYGQTGIFRKIPAGV